MNAMNAVNERERETVRMRAREKRIQVLEWLFLNAGPGQMIRPGPAH